MVPEDNLTLQLRELVAEAESRFGSREPGWTLLAAYNSNPARYAPCTLPDSHVKIARVVLSDNAQGDPIRTRFQLAHEAIHCLAPEARPDAVNIEEGVATLFCLTASGIPAWYAQQVEATCLPVAAISNVGEENLRLGMLCSFHAATEQRARPRWHHWQKVAVGGEPSMAKKAQDGNR